MTTESKVETPRAAFVSAEGRTRAFKLKWPVTVEGKVYDEVHLARLTVAEVSEFIEKLKATQATGSTAWPVYKLPDGSNLPLHVFEALDDDDGFALEKAARDFLPLRLRAASEGATGPAGGEVTGSS